MAESQWLNREFNYGLSVQLLVAAGSDVNAADSQGSTPLQVCVCGGGAYVWATLCWCTVSCCKHRGLWVGGGGAIGSGNMHAWW
jgi:hypothetical protein